MWIEWNNETKSFCYYDKDKKEKVPLPKGFKFLWIKENHKVGGFNNDKECGIRSNEIQDLSKEELKVMFNDKNTSVIAKGLYSEIKETVNDAGGKYMKCVYVMTEKKNLVCLQISGAVLQSFVEFSGTLTKEDKLGRWINVVGSEDRKKGSVKYSIPVFKAGDFLVSDMFGHADLKYNELMDHFEGKDQKSRGNEYAQEDDSSEVNEPEAELEGSVEDDLPI
jgi:hypothetical protein